MGTLEMTRERGTLEKIVRSLLPYMAVGAVVGGAIGFYQGFTDGELVPALLALDHDWTLYIASLLTLAYVAGGLIGMAAPLFPQRLAKALEVQPEDIADQPRFYRLQGVSALLFGLAIGVLVLANPLAIVSSGLAFALFALCVAGGLAAYLKSAKMMDELMQATAAEAMTRAYGMIVAVGGGWAVLGHLGLAAGPGFLDIVNILWGMIILATLWSGTKRGVFYEA